MGNPAGRLWDRVRRDPPAAAARTAAALLLGTALLALTLPRTHSPRPEPIVRVRAAQGMPSLTIEGRGLARVRLDDSGPITLTLPLEVSARDGAHVRTERGTSRSARRSVEIEALPGASLSVFGRAWGPRLTLSVDDAGTLDLVVPVPMERYVAGVLSGELFAEWPVECFRAQAIAARSYAAHQMTRSEVRVYDVEAGDRDQVFLAGAPLGRAIEAARSTRGLVLTDGDGRPLRAYFSSTCGGRAASARQIWPATGSLDFNAAEPLNGPVRAHACNDAPLYRWERRRGTSELSGRVAAWGKQTGHAARRLGRLRSVEVADAAPSGRPGWYVLIDAGGLSVRIRADDLRVALNFAGDAPLARGGWVPSNDLEVTIDRERATITGRGFGHGVGLCQYCAAEWARRGLVAEQMLGAFYPGAMLERLYDGVE